ncbi:MAG: FIST C-terminal domain-containing protein [Planctomycetes bacterium]|nr:FIST C-terminal domain-containing protein [Planctomycetota bacterium]
MRFRTTFAQISTGDPVANAREAAAKIQRDFSGTPPAVVIFFAATDYHPATLAEAMHEGFPGSVTIGCTTAGEGVDATLLNGSVVAMACGPEVFDYCETALILGDGAANGQEGIFSAVDDAVKYISRGLLQSPMELNYREYVGFILSDRVSHFSEGVIERLGSLTDIFFVGGFAGDDCKFEGSNIFYRGRAYQNAVLLALWKPRRGFDLIKTQAVEVTEHSMVITRADEANRIVWEFDGEDAASVYSRLIGVPVESMGIPEFDAFPLARTADGEPFLQVSVRLVDGKGLQLFSSVKEGTRLTLTRSADIVSTTAKALRDQLWESGPVSAVLHTNCVSRHMNLKNAGQIADFEKLFAGIPGIAFSSYGEIYVGLVGMTSTMILFK